ncbi:S8 family serine peptidase [Candidatus Uhrbacteria bacterium]|nr:S8 family serine peptidase [Candidatus Uhrbacteria bacterium]
MIVKQKKWLISFLIGFLVSVMHSGSFAYAQTIGINDTFLEKEWHLSAINAPMGWIQTTGTSDVVVAVIDSGVDIDHPDLRSNIWTNPNEIPNNQKDDDENGFVDDVHGWNFVEQSNDVRPIISKNGIDEAFIHGTVVASLIGARGNNNVGIAGIAWNVRLMPIVVLDSQGEGSDVDIAQAIRYAVAQGADIINLSFVGYQKDEILATAVNEATSQGVLIVSAAGNGETTSGEDLDKTAGFPACDKGAGGKGAMSVTAIDKNGKKADYANFGTCVDVSAPGEDLFAARPTYKSSDRNLTAAGYRGNLSGTSVAAPLVTGLAALIKSQHPDWTAEEIAQHIRSTAQSVDQKNPNNSGKIGTGQINIARALATDQLTKQPRSPFFLEASLKGQRSMVRILSNTGEAIQYIDLGLSKAAQVRASFLHWQIASLPDIAVTSDDASGSWKINRWDGILLAAGTVGKSDIKGGLMLASQDLDADGKDELLLLEAKGSRMWLVSANNKTPLEIKPFEHQISQGSSALSVSRPRSGFLIASRGNDRQIVIIGRNGSILAHGPTSTARKSSGWSIRRAARKGNGSVYELQAKDGKLILMNDGSGLTPTNNGIPVTRWTQVPDGQVLHDGWLYYESWPR